MVSENALTALSKVFLESLDVDTFKQLNGAAEFDELLSAGLIGIVDVMAFDGNVYHCVIVTEKGEAALEVTELQERITIGNIEYHLICEVPVGGIYEDAAGNEICVDFAGAIVEEIGV